ncbi:MAG: 2-hydroxyacid dehydrogenase [Vagococcus sp.]
MTLKIICYGVRENERTYFEDLNKYQFDLTLVEELLTHENIETVKGHEAVLLRGNCVADYKNIEKMAAYGVSYLFTRTVGYNHIDLTAAAEFNLDVARVPSYSPNAIAELSLTLAMMLLRSTAHTTLRTSNKNFVVDNEMFSKEIRNCTVGVIGTGKIGVTEANLFKGLGARVIGYDVFQNEVAKSVLTFKELDELLAESDIVSVHVPYFPGENDKMINKDFLSKMKKGAILINTARGELQDDEAILDALESDKLAGFGTDVFANEKDLFFKEFQPWEPLPNKTVQSLIHMYPRVLVTPHIGSNTDEALSNMIETSFENFNDMVTFGKTDNRVPM